MQNVILIALFICAMTPTLANAHELKPYSIELSSGFRYDSGTGTVASSPEDAGTEINDVTTDIHLGVGFILGDTMEPVVEVSYRAVDRKVDTFTGSDKSLSYGLGILFNMPIVSDRKGKKKGPEEKVEDLPDFVRAQWIPYLGFLLSQDSESESRGVNSQFTVDNGNLITKLVIGIRWMVYPNVGMNFNLRASYQDTRSSAKSSIEEGGSVRKLEIETRLLELSLFI